jgi:hypothetical protein
MPTVAPLTAKTPASIVQGTMPVDDENTLNWLLGWTLSLAAIIAVTRTKAGYAIVYYMLFLLVVFLMLTQYKWVTQELSYATFELPAINSKTAQGTRAAEAMRKTAAPVNSAWGPGGLISV